MTTSLTPDNTAGLHGFAVTLKRFRERAGLSQSKLAERSGHDHSFISRLESGARTPTRDAVTRLSEALALGPDDYETLLRSAGFLGRARTTDEAMDAFPELRDLAEMLIDETVSVSYRGSVRMLISACCQQAAAIKGVAA